MSADSENSVKNGAELLDRLLKDIISEKATSYISLLHNPKNQPNGDVEHDEDESGDASIVHPPSHRTTAFSLTKFVPLLSERLYVINPYTRIFLVSWITVLNSIPDLDLIVFLPDFLDGLIKFLSDTNQDVRVATSRLLDSFLEEIKRIALSSKTDQQLTPKNLSATLPQTQNTENEPLDEVSSESEEMNAVDDFVDFSRLISILRDHLTSSDEAIQLTALRWVSEFFAICPANVLPFTPKLLRVVLPAISHESTALRWAARDVNDKLLKLIRNLVDGNFPGNNKSITADIEELDFVNSATVQLYEEVS